MYLPQKRHDFLRFVIPDEEGFLRHGTIREDAPEDVKWEWERYQKMLSDEAEQAAKEGRGVIRF